MESKPTFKGTIQIKDPTSPHGFKTVGAVKLYLINQPAPPQTDGMPDVDKAAALAAYEKALTEFKNKNPPTYKGYIGINEKEFYEVSLWETL